MQSPSSTPPSLPVSNPTLSYWQDPPDPILSNYVSKDSPSTEPYDVLIIGSGISGATIAWNLLNSSPEKPERILMLEARSICSGASGRNGGHTKAGSYREFAANKAAHGLEAAVQIANFEYSSIVSLHQFIHTHSIPCDLSSRNTVDVFYCPKALAAAEAAVSDMRWFLEPEGAGKYVWYDADEAREQFFNRTGKREKGDGVLGALEYEAGSLSAYKLVCGILKLCLESASTSATKQFEILTNTPALSLSPTPANGDNWAVETSRGNIQAKKVILATNAYTAFLAPQFQGKIVPFRGQVIAQRPGAVLPTQGLRYTYSFIYSNGYEYMISRPPGSTGAGDVILGGGLAHAADAGKSQYGTTDDAVLDGKVSAYLRAALQGYFGGEGWDRVEAEWTGIMGESCDGHPWVGRVPDAAAGAGGLWTSASFQGHGMVLCWLSGRALVEMLRAEEGENGGGGEGGLEEWFPDCFRITEERMAREKGRGRAGEEEAPGEEVPGEEVHGQEVHGEGEVEVE